MRLKAEIVDVVLELLDGERRAHLALVTRTKDLGVNRTANARMTTRSPLNFIAETDMVDG
jgi:hypothetical protein